MSHEVIENPSKLIVNFVERLNRSGVTAVELHRRSGVHWVTISRLKNYRVRPSVAICEKLARAAGIDLEKMFTTPLDNT